MILASVYQGKKMVGRCDARCYDNTVGACYCICGGANHGRGAVRAAETKREVYESELGRWCALRGIEVGRVELVVGGVQLSLFQ